jgi:hypothetical protein
MANENTSGGSAGTMAAVPLIGSQPRFFTSRGDSPRSYGIRQPH